LALVAKKIKRAVATSWRIDETFIKVKGEWVYLYRAFDKFGDTVDFVLSEPRDERAATAFFKQAIGANYAGLKNIKILLMLAGLISFVEILRVKYLNNLIKQDHRFIKKITNPMMEFKTFHLAKAPWMESKPLI
jgi:putative transposase